MAVQFRVDPATKPRATARVPEQLGFDVGAP